MTLPMTAYRPRSDTREAIFYNEAEATDSNSDATLARGNIGQIGTLVDLLNASAYDPHQEDEHDEGSDDESSLDPESEATTPVTPKHDPVQAAVPHEYKPSEHAHRPRPRRGDSIFKGHSQHDEILRKELLLDNVESAEAAIARAQNSDREEDFVDTTDPANAGRTPEEMLDTLHEEFGPWIDDSEKFVMQTPGALYRSSVLIKGIIALTNRRLFLYAFIPPPDASEVIRAGSVIVHPPGQFAKKRKVWVEMKSDTITWYASSTKTYKPLGSARWSQVKAVRDYDPNNPLRYTTEMIDGRVLEFEYETAEAAMRWHAEVRAALFTFRSTSDKLRLSLPLQYVTKTVVTPFTTVAEQVQLTFDTVCTEKASPDHNDAPQTVEFGYLRSHSIFTEKLIEHIEASHSLPRCEGTEPILEIDSPTSQAELQRAKELREDTSLPAQFALKFALADEPSSIWTSTGVGLVRTLPVWGSIAISSSYFCFWRHGVLVSDVLVRVPLVDIDDAIPIRAFGFRIWGLAIQVHGAPDCRLDFTSKKARDDVVDRLKTAVLEAKVTDMAINRTNADRSHPPSLSTQSSFNGSNASTMATSEHSEQPSLHIKTDSQSMNTSTSASTQSPYIMSPLKPAFGVTSDKAYILGQSVEEDFAVTGVTKMLPLPVLVGSSGTRRKVTGMHFVCLTIGSRGDVQPYIALGIELKKDGNRVTIASHPEYRKWVESFDLEYKDVGGDPGALMKLSVEHKMFSPGFFKESLGHFRQWLDDLFHESWEACQEADVLLESPSTFAGIHVAEALKIPYMRCFTMPWTPTSTYPHAFAAGVDLGSGYNLMSYSLFDSVIWKAMSGQVNRWRRNELGLKSTTEKKLKARKAPFIYNFSSAVVPKPMDWKDAIFISGYWFLPPDERQSLDPKLVDFIERARADGKPLIYIGFGSIVVPDASAVTRAVVQAVENSDVRAILSKGWSERGNKKHEEVPLPDSIFSVASVAHDLLFPLIDAACHHGGAGTTGASLRAGLPTLIHPFFGDQFFWATRVTKLGAGVRIDTLSEKDLTTAFKRATTDRVLKEKAEDVGKKIRMENGPRRAIEFIYDHLNLALERSTERAARAAGTHRAGSSTPSGMIASPVVPSHSSDDASSAGPSTPTTTEALPNKLRKGNIATSIFRCPSGSRERALQRASTVIPAASSTSDAAASSELDRDRQVLMLRIVRYSGKFNDDIVAAMKVIPVPCRSDNYMYIIQDEATSTTAVVDPYDPAKLAKAAQDNNLKIGEILITTHHHADHSGGNEQFVEQYGTKTIYAGSDKSPKANKLLKHQDTFQIGNLKVTALHTPCHTQDHICYYVEDEANNQRAVFTGFFEGTPQEMHTALNERLAKLPDDTITYVGHEYTASNVAFSKSIDPENKAIRDLVDFCKNNEVTTGKFTIGDEKAFNVFMRLQSQAVKGKS
ncbi:hypothetical protein OIO90_004045 [Microbotryomycetes sp. JL221]|nr:hypothetical protein OIO90_004045 [Microbotryomycetes sp. JL221]